MDAKGLATFLDNNRENPLLSIPYASLTDELVLEVSKFVRDNPFVQNLDIRGNNIRVSGALAIANAIKLNRSLRCVKLKQNYIGEDNKGLAALCNALKPNLTICFLDLRSNRIDLAGAKCIADMLTVNTAITHIDLAWNNFGVEGGVALLDGLRENKTLVDCQLGGSKAGKDVLHEVAYLTRKNRKEAALNAPPVTDQARPKTPTSSATPSSLANASGAVGGLPRSQWTAKECSAILLRLLMQEREQGMPQDKLFYQEIGQHTEKLLQEKVVHKGGVEEGQRHETLSSDAFGGREDRYIGEVRRCEETITSSINEIEKIKTTLEWKTKELARFEEEAAQAVRDSAETEDALAMEERRLEDQYRALAKHNKDCRDRLFIATKDYELLTMENDRLREFLGPSAPVEDLGCDQALL